MTLPGEEQVGGSRAPLGARLFAFARMGNEAYQGGDLRLSRRIGVAVLVLSSLIMLGLAIVAPPTERFGVEGWVVLAGIVGVFSLFAWRLGAPGSVVGFGELYAMSLTGIFSVAAMEWLAGTNAAPYHELYLFWAVYTGVVHSPRRVLFFLGLVALLVPSGFLVDSVSSVKVADFAIEYFVWAALTLFGTIWTLNVRRQRVRALSGEQDAIQLARVDPLTGLGNRRAFDEALDAEVARAERTGKPLSVVVADLDGFKAINDRFGHLNGDQCLKAAAGAIHEVVRVPDACFRWGGDEFAVLLAETDRLGAQRVAERMRRAVNEMCSAPDGVPLTLACGTAELCDEMGCSDLIAAADLALMSLKSRGRSAAHPASESESAA